MLEHGSTQTEERAEISHPQSIAVRDVALDATELQIHFEKVARDLDSSREKDIVDECLRKVAETYEVLFGKPEDWMNGEASLDEIKARYWDGQLYSALVEDRPQRKHLAERLAGAVLAEVQELAEEDTDAQRDEQLRETRVQMADAVINGEVTTDDLQDIVDKLDENGY